MAANMQDNKGSAISLTDEEAVKQLLVKTVFGLWDIVNDLTRLKPSKNERYRAVLSCERGKNEQNHSRCEQSVSRSLGFPARCRDADARETRDGGIREKHIFPDDPLIQKHLWKQHADECGNGRRPEWLRIQPEQGQ